MKGWLEPSSALPEDVELAAAVGQARRARSTISSAEPHRERPYCECLAASANVSRLIGTPLGHLRLSVVETFPGIRASLREYMGSRAEAGSPPLT